MMAAGRSGLSFRLDHSTSSPPHSARQIGFIKIMRFTRAGRPAVREPPPRVVAANQLDPVLQACTQPECGPRIASSPLAEQSLGGRMTKSNSFKKFCYAPLAYAGAFAAFGQIRRAALWNAAA